MFDQSCVYVCLCPFSQRSSFYMKLWTKLDMHWTNVKYQNKCLLHFTHVHIFNSYSLYCFEYFIEKMCIHRIFSSLFWFFVSVVELILEFVYNCQWCLAEIDCCLLIQSSHKQRQNFIFQLRPIHMQTIWDFVF